MKARIIITLLIAPALLPRAAAGGDDCVILVRPGATARKISRDYLIRPTSWERVVQYNYILKPGTAVRVPAELIKRQGKAFLKSIQGEVFVKFKGENRWRPAVAGLVIQNGDRVRTAYDSAAEILFSDHDRALLRGQTEIEFEYHQQILQGTANCLTVIRGEVIASGNGTGKHPIRYEIKTANSRGVLKGTSLRTKVLKNGEARFEVLSGELSLTSGGKTVTVPVDCGVSIPPKTR